MWGRVDRALSFSGHPDRAVLILFALHVGLLYLFKQRLNFFFFFCQEEGWTIIASVPLTVTAMDV